ncbi:MAG: AI-2E family transporter [Draconibacterium sp.]|nr:AI-2E family transporter [Draconibacterium sp.]
MNFTKKIYVFLIIITVVVVLIYAQSIIIPFILAILFWFIIRVIKKLLLNVKFVDRLPNWLITLFSSIVLLSILYFAIGVITVNIQDLSETMPVYEANVSKITNNINEKFNIDLFTIFSDYAKDFEFASILTSLFSSLTGIFGSAFTIILYLIFLLLEEPIFPKKLKAMYPDKNKYKHVNELINKIDISIGNYIALKTVVSLITGTLSYFALLFIGVNEPLFWAFLIFVLNFIPTIGSLIATIFPTFFAILQYGEFTQGFLVLAIVGSIQLVVGNFVEPKLMGNTLNISPLVVFLTLAIWGVMWGITGMLLSVPITVILIIIMSEFPETRPFAILLSQRGKLND